MSDFALHVADATKIQKLLGAFQTTLKAEYLLLCHRDGTIIAQSGILEETIDSSTLAVLVVASHSSAMQIGNLLGGSTFRTISYLGTQKSIGISAVGNSLLLVQIFPGVAIPVKLEEFAGVLESRLMSVVPHFIENTSRLRRPDLD